jgi:YD repeat-containing protein
MTRSVEEPRGRSDARRNRETAIEAALAVLADDPNASMAAIAERSGLGRTTLYRHFPARRDLLIALFERVIDEAYEATSAVIDAGRPTAATLRALGPAIIAIADRYRFLHGSRPLGEELISASVRDPDQPLRRFLAAAQERGEVHRDLPVDWIVIAVNGLATTTANEMNESRLSLDAAGRLLGETLARAFATAPEA